MADFLDPARTIEAVAERFLQYAQIECGRLPLYERLSQAVARDRDLLELAANAPSGQPVTPLFLASVQFVLLQHLDDPLAQFYPNLSVPIAEGDPFPAFRDFCLRHAGTIAELVRTRRVQTNEVRRCACFLPAVARLTERGPLAWIEAGTSAGLNLNWPSYAYAFSDGRRCGDASSPVRLECELRGTPPPLPSRFPEIGRRFGFDLHPLDVEDPEDARWLQAMVWPDQIDRFARLRDALALARQHPVDVRQGDVLALLPELVETTDGALHMCVVHSYMMNQMSHPQRDALERLFETMSHRRAITRIHIEWLDGGAFPLLELHEYRDGRPISGGVLASCHWHGDWLQSC